MSEVGSRNVVMACLGIPAPDGSKQGPGHRCWLCTLQQSSLLLETRHGEDKGGALLCQDAVWPHTIFWEQGGTAGCPSASRSLEHLIQASLEVPLSCQLKVPRQIRQLQYHFKPSKSILMLKSSSSLCNSPLSFPSLVAHSGNTLLAIQQAKSRNRSGRRQCLCV